LHTLNLSKQNNRLKPRKISSEQILFHQMALSLRWQAFNRLNKWNVDNFLASVFPAEIRYTAVAIIQNAAMAIFAGLAPLYVSTLTHYFNVIMIPAKVLTIAYAIQIIAILIVIIFGKKLKASTENYL